MAELQMSQVQRMATLLSGAIKGMVFYPAGHPATQAPLREFVRIFEEASPSANELRMGIIDGIFFVDEHLFFAPSAAIEELARHFLERDIHGLVFSRGLTFEEMQRFIALAVQPLDYDRFVRALADQNISHIRPFVADEETPSDDNDAKDLDPHGTYEQAISTIRGIFREIESGRIPNSDKLIQVVDRMATLTIQEPAALIGLAMLKDYDNYTFNHSVNVGILAMALSSAVGLDAAGVKETGVAGFLHDVGKTRVAKSILNKPGKLTAAEYEQMKQHSEEGAKIISEMSGVSKHVAQAVLGHHVGFNRAGYPEWARELPFGELCAIITVADCYDAITSLRVYQQYPLNPKGALDTLNKLAGSHLDERLVNMFNEMMGKYPVGTLVRLASNEIAVVYRPNPADADTPDVKVIIDGTGEMLPEPRLEKLGYREGGGAAIVAVVDPLIRNIDVAKYLA